MSASRPIDDVLRDLEARASMAQRQQRLGEAAALWQEMVALEPNHVRAWTALGQQALQSGDFAAARHSLDRAAQASRNDPTPWNNLATACREMGDAAAEADAITEALKIDASDLLALLMRGNLHERQGSLHQAAQAYGAAATVAPAMERLRPDLRPILAHALTFKIRYQKTLATFMDERLALPLREVAGANLSRFNDSLDILLGRKKRYDAQPVQFYFPGLQPIEFFPRQDFAWLDDIEAATPLIRNEFMSVLNVDRGFVPYMNYEPDQPLNQWVELNRSPRWSAYHLLKDGLPVAGNAERCPATMQALAGAPQPQQPGRTPVAMFSLLKPRTRIPPHTGVSNARLVTHLPLIVPPHCGFRVGNETRQWIPGRAWVFDDTIEHEAWNESDELRVVLIFDIWHPHLTPPERLMVGAMWDALSAFSGVGGFDL